MVKGGNNIKVFIKLPTKEKYREITIPQGTKLNELIDLWDLKGENGLDILAGKINNKIEDLTHELKDKSQITLIDLTSEDGVRIYKRSLFFILAKVVRQLYPDHRLSVRHHISRGTYCEIYGNRSINSDDIKLIEEKMKELVNSGMPMDRSIVSLQEARDIFKKSKDYDKVSLLRNCKKNQISIYKCGDMANYLYGHLVPNTKYLKKFKLMNYSSGFILRYPDLDSPYEIAPYEESKQLFEILKEHKKWGEILDVSHVGSLNNIIVSGNIREFIQMSEALHEKKISNIADMIKMRVPDVRVILISGPSSSGKTTFAHRLSIHLRVNALKPVTISLDDYFVDRYYTPLDEHGKPDFEALEAIDIELFNSQLNDLIAGKNVEVPIYDFHKGQRKKEGRNLQLDNDHIIIVEGIHGLNEKLTQSIHYKNKFKVYVSALTQLSMDDYNPISTTDTRLLRRMIRDYKYRSNPAINTLKMWHSVRRGEKKNIFPFQEQADIMFNSALVYELAVLKDYALPLLEDIDNLYEQYSEARKLIDFLGYFVSIPPDYIPPTSIIREFIGGSSISY